MNTVGILGTIHNAELRNKYGCTLELYKEIILEFKPDIICGEVHPHSWQKYLTNKNDKGYWGEPASEYWELVFPLCEEFRIEFVPIDWFELDVWNHFAPFSGYSDEDKIKLEKMDNEWFSKQMNTYCYGRIPFNSAQFDDLARQKYEWLFRINPVSQNFRWVVRNHIMIQRVMNAVTTYPEKRILCIVGADHNYFFFEELSKQSIILKYPLRK